MCYWRFLGIKPFNFFPIFPKVVKLEVNEAAAEEENTKKMLPAIYAIIDFI